MHVKALLVLVGVALLLAGTGCGGSVCVGYACVSWGPCYPYCYYDAFVGWVDSIPWSFPRWAAVGDFDGDQAADLVLLDDAQGLTFLAGGVPALKQGLTTALPSGDGLEARRVLPGHLDGDGLLDLVLIGEVTGSVEVLLGTGDGGFLPAVGAPLPTLAAGLVDVDLAPLDGDALADLLVLGEDGGLVVYRADGAGGFLAPDGAPVVVPDVTADTRLVCTELDGRPGLDLAVVMPGAQRVSILPGLGDGTSDVALTLPAQIPEPLFDATWCVSDGEGLADLVLLVGVDDGEHQVVRLRVDGVDAGLLVEPMLGVKGATRIEAADVSGDGVPDLMLLDGETGTVEFLRTAL